MYYHVIYSLDRTKLVSPFSHNTGAGLYICFIKRSIFSAAFYASVFTRENAASECSSITFGMSRILSEWQDNLSVSVYKRRWLSARGPHSTEMSSNDTDLIYCSLCDLYFNSQEERAIHIRDSEKHPSCDKCDRRFSNTMSLRNVSSEICISQLFSG